MRDDDASRRRRARTDGTGPAPAIALAGPGSRRSAVSLPGHDRPAGSGSPDLVAAPRLVAGAACHRGGRRGLGLRAGICGSTPSGHGGPLSPGRPGQAGPRCQPAIEWSRSRCPTLNRTMETWFVRGKGGRQETRSGDKLIGVVVNNGRWEFRWDVAEHLVAAWSTATARQAQRVRPRRLDPEQRGPGPLGRDPQGRHPHRARRARPERRCARSHFSGPGLAAPGASSGRHRLVRPRLAPPAQAAVGAVGRRGDRSHVRLS